jgi:hypothetical protein
MFRGMRRRLIIAGIAAVIAIITVAELVSFRRQPLLSDDFGQPDGLITNEFAYHNPHDPAARISPVWIATSGSLFARDHAGWTGVPDRAAPGPLSAGATDSSVFRVITRQAGFQDVTVSFSLFVQRFLPAPTSWQGVHVFLRYVNPDLLYVISVDRRDGVVVIKKKVPGGPSAGGTYYPLATAHGTAIAGRWTQVTASAVNSGADVDLKVWVDGRFRLQAVDGGAGGVAPITQPGRVGLRGDYTDFMFRGFAVTSS